MATGRCMKCKKDVDIKDAQSITLKNGKPATTGFCPDCGAKVFRFDKKAAV